MKARETGKQTSSQRAVWRNGGCASLESVAKQQVTWLVASIGSPPLRQAATTLCDTLRTVQRETEVKINNIRKIWQ